MRAYLSAMRRYASFTGRTSRAEYWRAHLVLLPLMLLAFAVVGLPWANLPGSAWPVLLFLLLVGPHLVPWSALTIRRLHDMDRSGWWAALGLIPFIVALPLGVLVLLAWACLAGTRGPSRYGQPQDDGPATGMAASATPTSAAGSHDPVGEVEKLARLHAAGSITDAEFSAMKSQVLGRG